MKNIYSKILFIAVLAGLVVVSLIMYQNLNNYIVENRSISHSKEIIITAESVLSSVKDVVVGTRGFLLTHDSIFLQPYLTAIALLPGQLSTLDSLAAGNSEQKKNINTLKGLIDDRLTVTQNIFQSVKPTELSPDKYQRSLLDEGKQHMDAIRAEIKEMLDVEERQITRSKNDRENIFQTSAPISLFTFTLIALGAVTLLFIRSWGTLSDREKAIDLAKHNLKQLQREKAFVEEQKTILNEAESLARMGSWKWASLTDTLVGSEGLYKIFDKAPGETLTWNTFLENVFPEDLELVTNCLHEVKTNKQGYSIDYRIIKHGTIRHLSLTVKPHQDFNTDILGAVIDITNRKEQEQKLKQYSIEQAKTIQELDENEKKYRTLFERSVDPIFLASDKLVLMDVNSSFINFCGYTEAEDVSVASLFANAGDYEHFKTTLAKIQQIRDFETLLITQGGVKKPCLVNCIAVPNEALGFSFYQGIIHDLTLRKQAENDMLIAERLALTGKISRTVAHEVRNPLTNVNLALDQLREETPAENESAKMYLDVIERNAKRIGKLVDEMLDSSKATQLDLMLTPVSEIIDETVSMAQDRLQLKQIKLLTEYQHDLPPILVDKAKIQIALLNIIINAVEAMIPGEGVLKIETSTIDKVLTIAISDNGKGISGDEIGKLFDPFFTSKVNGMGLGLTSTKNILNRHNAKIAVKSELEKGTTFAVHFTLEE
jgi:PAS domain S-box-containing protein